MIAIRTKMVTAVQDAFSIQIRAQYESAIAKLEAIDTKKINDATHHSYLLNLIKVFKANPDIITAEPEALKKLTAKFKSLPTVIAKKDGKAAVTARENFVKKIHVALNYSGLRSSFYPGYFSEIGLKTCVYCNSQLAVTIFKANGKYSARFDVDHHISKNLYPGLAISLFNLYPACAPCNRRKSQLEVEFELYSENEEYLKQSQFIFKLDPYAKAKYLLSPEINNIDFAMYDRGGTIGFSHEKFFSINAIYRTQKDIAQELIIKSQIYDQAYKKLLQEKFAMLGLTDADIQRITVGNYTKEVDIHKRPLSKFVQDVARELGLI